MRFPHSLHLLALLSLLPFLSATTLHIHLPPLPSLPPSTHATLTTHNLTISTPLRRSNTFSFANLPAGSYLGEIYCRDYTFSPMRVDVSGEGSGEAKIEVWQTFRGNEWENKGERLGEGVRSVRVEAKGAGEKGYYEGRGGFSITSLFKNPMILIAVVGMGMMIGMPYLLDSMDPETRKEFEEAQKAGPLAGVTGGGNPMAGFDIASYMAGSGAKSTSSGVEEGGGGKEGGGSKARRRG